MRYYYLQVGAIELEAGKKNTVGLNIAFDVQVYDQNYSTIPAYVRIDNADLSFFKAAQLYKNMPFVLRAGLIQGSKYTAGLPSSSNDVLIKGLVTNVIGDFSDITSSVYIYTQPARPQEITVAKQMQHFQGTIENNEKLADALLTLTHLESLLKEGYSVKWSKKAKELTWLGGSCTVSGSSLELYLNQITMLDCLGSEAAKPDRLSYRFEDNVLLFRAQSELNKPEEGQLPKKIETNEIITQPVCNNIDNLQISLTINLRGNLKVGDIVELGDALASVSSLASNWGLGVNNITPPFVQGMYKIVSINHQGEFFNTSAQSWSTQLELVAVTGI